MMDGVSPMLSRINGATIRITLLILVLIGGTWSASSADEAPKPVMLIASIGAAENGVIANEVYLAVLNRLAQRISEMDYKVIAAEEEAPGNRSSDAAAVDQRLVRAAAEASQAPVKYFAAVQVFALTSIESVGTRIHIRINGRIREAASGEVVKHFTLDSPKDLMAPVKCNLGCVVKTLTDNAALLAERLSGDLAPHLAPR